MVDAINHDTGSSMSTAAWEGAKGAAKWGLSIVAFGAIAGAVIAASVFSAGIGGVLLGGFLGGVAGAVPTYFVGTPLALMGGMFGLMNGGSRVSKEKDEFNRQVEAHSHKRHNKMARNINNARMIGEQEGYGVGYQDGRASVMRDLQAAAMQEMGQGTVATAEAHAKCACGPATKAVLDRREASAVAAATGISTTTPG